MAKARAAKSTGGLRAGRLRIRGDLIWPLRAAAAMRGMSATKLAETLISDYLAHAAAPPIEPPRPPAPLPEPPRAAAPSTEAPAPPVPLPEPPRAAAPPIKSEDTAALAKIFLDRIKSLSTR